MGSAAMTGTPRRRDARNMKQIRIRWERSRREEETVTADLLPKMDAPWFCDPP
jgi:hypothetical protein